MCVFSCIRNKKKQFNHFGFKRTFSSQASRKKPAYYYEVLGLKPNATQAQIKSAYYKMSKLHHPDVSKNSESHAQFTEINRAYEVLGDLKKRRMYDMGLGQRSSTNQSTSTGGEEIDLSHAADSLKENDRSSPFFNDATKFDDFYKQHYNEIRERRKQEQSQYMHDKNISQGKSSRAVGLEGSLRSVTVLMFLALAIKILYNG